VSVQIIKELIITFETNFEWVHAVALLEGQVFIIGSLIDVFAKPAVDIYSVIGYNLLT
jgi:hypothetical protein